MTSGRVYALAPPRADGDRRTAVTEVTPLENLEPPVGGVSRLRGRFVHVRNAGALHAELGADSAPRRVPLGDAVSSPQGEFLFRPGRGGGRVDKVRVAERDFRERYIEASRFGEVNVYFHVDRIASHVDGLLRELGATPLPRVTAVVNAHHAATEVDASGARDGVRGPDRWLPFQGGHYRLPGKAIGVAELEPIEPTGEIHLGPGRKLLEAGALVELAGGRYRANASHNPGIIYHEYGHHISRHTADMSANRLRPAERQDNRKTALDEGTSDYWAATMLGTPHIWLFHRSSDLACLHPRSVCSPRTMADFDANANADPHANGTIWASALWEIRTVLAEEEADGVRTADRLVLAGLLRLGRAGAAPPGRPGPVRRAKSSFAAAATALLEADEDLHGGRHEAVIRRSLARRGIGPSSDTTGADACGPWPAVGSWSS